MPELSDIFGIKPYGEALKIIVEKSAEGTGKFLAAICIPAAEEFGLMLQDKIRYWRLKNIIKMLDKTRSKLDFQNDKLQLSLNPRIGIEIIDNSSWQDDETILQMWAGLLDSSLSRDAYDDSNLIFINLLKSVTKVQAKIINHICSSIKVSYDKNGLIFPASDCEINLEHLFNLTNCNDINRLDREIDDLRAKDLLPSSSMFSNAGGGFSKDQEDFTKVKITPSPLALHFYSRVNGFKTISDCYK